MKTLCIILLMGSISYNAIAQKIIEKHINFANKESVSLDIQITDSIHIQTWNKNEIFARASVSINEDKDNDVYRTTFKESGKRVTISAEFDSDYFKESDTNVDGDIFWDIYIPEKVDFAVETINGDITITGKTSEIDASTISGFIDITVSSDKNVDLTMETITGTIYSNSEFDVTEHEYSHASVIDAKMNGGGSPLKLKTISGDIYFRVK